MTYRLNSDNKVVGLKQVRRAVEAKEVITLFYAKDADEHITSSIVNECSQDDVEIIEVETMKELGEACNIDINAAIAALLK